MVGVGVASGCVERESGDSGQRTGGVRPWQVPREGDAVPAQPLPCPMDLTAAVSLLRSRVPGLVLVVLFGSRARGDARADSDVDLALLADAPIETLTLFDLRSDLEGVVGAPVDLVDLWRADDVLRVQVVEHAQVLFERSAVERERFELLALARYARLNEERAGILEDVRRRGSVHG